MRFWYILFQLAGWSAMWFIELFNYIVLSGEQFLWSVPLRLLTYPVFGLILSHLLHYFILRKVNFSKSLAILFFEFILGSFIFTIVLSLCPLLIGFIFERELVFSTFSWQVFLLNLLNLYRYTSVWMGVCFMVKTIINLHNLELESAKIKSDSFEVELRSLQRQLNPHFLFNVLNGIKSMISSAPHEAKDAIVNLSNIMRHLLNSKSAMHSVESELKLIDEYLQLENIRFYKRLLVVNDRLILRPDVKIPTGVFLSLVENSIKHGISTFYGEEQLLIACRVNLEDVSFSVTNTTNSNDQEGQGVGNHFVSNSLRQAFGDSFSFTQHKANNRYTSSILISR